MFSSLSRSSSLPRSVSVLAAGALLLGACSSNEAPETLPMVDDAAAPDRTEIGSTTTSTIAASATTDSGVTSEQQAMLDDCASALQAAAEGLDPASADYSTEVVAAVMGPDALPMQVCGPLLEPASGIDRQYVVDFMIENLPPELLGALGSAMPQEASVDDSVLDESGLPG